MVSYSVGGSDLLFVEAEVFTECVRALLDDCTYRQFQNALVRNPEKGAVMPNCGGLRKVRVEDPRRGKGKRGGFRVIYLHIPEAQRIDLLAIYSKDKQDDLTGKQRKALKAMAERARREALVRKQTRKDTQREKEDG
jgi:mRNA-degrading endonuclease RelE of RelBE toxin-antitoxin system